MARKIKKNCLHCKSTFLGRSDAKTCSARCRKAWQRAQQAVAKDAEVFESKIAEAAKQVEQLIIPEVVSEAGFIETAEPPAAVGVAPSQTPSDNSPLNRPGAAAETFAVEEPPAPAPLEPEQVQQVAATEPVAAQEPIPAAPEPAPEPAQAIMPGIQPAQPEPVPTAPVGTEPQQPLQASWLDNLSAANRPVGADVLPNSADIAPAELRTPIQPAIVTPEPAQQMVDLGDPASRLMLEEEDYARPSRWYGIGHSRIRMLQTVTAVVILLVGGGIVGGYLSGHTKKTPSSSTPPSLSSLNNGALAANNLDQSLHINFKTLASQNLTATGNVLIQNDSSNGLQVQGAGGSNLLVVDTAHQKVGVGGAPTGAAKLQVIGDISSSGQLVSAQNSYKLNNQGLFLNGVLVCTATGCAPNANPSLNGVARLSGNQTFTGINRFTAGGNIFVGDGSGLSALNAGQITSGTLSDNRLSGNVALRNSNNTFSANNTFTSLIQAAGGVNASSYSVGGTAGSNFACAPGDLVQSATVTGGIITGGSCATVSGANPTLQNIYDNSAPAKIVLSSANGPVDIQDAVTPIGVNLFEVESNGGGTTYFAVSSNGIDVSGNVNTNGQYQVNGSQISSSNLSDGANLAKLNGNQTFTGINSFTNAGNSFTGNGSGLTNVNAAQLNGQPGSFYTNASNISSGTLNDARLSNNVTLAGNTFNGASELVQLTAGGILPILNGSNLNSLNATNISSGTLADARLSANVTLAGNTFNGANQLVKLDGSGNLPPLDGSALFNLNATNISIGTLSDARLSANVTLAGNTFNGASELVQLDSFGRLPVLDGRNLTTLNASNVSSGTLADARLTSNVALLNRAGQVFTGDNTFKLDSTTAFQVQNSLGTSNLFVADTTNSKVGIGLAPSSLGAALQVSGRVDATTGFSVNGTTGLASLSCAANELLQHASISGGIVTAGNCIAPAGQTTPTFQDVYDASVASPQITLDSSPGADGLVIQDAVGGLAGDLFTVQANTADGGAKYLNVTSGGVSVTGDINITGQYKVGGVQISTSDLSNAANIALLNAGQTFTGINNFSNASNSFTGDGSGLANLNATNISSGTLSDGRLSANVALKSANNIFTGNNTFTLNSTALSVQDASSPLGTTLFQVTDNSGATKYFTVSATALQFLGNDVCTTGGNCVGVSGGAIGGGGTAGKLAKFTGGGFTVGDSIISDNGSTVTIGGNLSVNTITPTASLTVGATGQGLTLQGDGTTTISATAGGVTNSVVFAGPTVSNKTITIPDASGTVAVSASGPLSLDAAGNLSCPDCLTTNGSGGGSGVSSVNLITGAVTLAGTANQVIITPSSGTLTFSTPQDIGTSSNVNFGNVNVTGQFKVGGSQISSANLSNDSDLAKLSANQTFTGNNTFNNTLTAPGITAGGAALGIGASTDTLNLAGTYSSNWVVTNGTNSTTIGFAGIAAHDITYNFDVAAPAGTYTICTTIGNCAGSGSGVTVSSPGTSGTIAMFTGTQTIANSIITQSGGTVTVGGTLDATTLTQGGTNVLLQSTAFSGDVSGTYNSTSVDKLKGTPLSISALADTNFLIYNSTTGHWENHSISSDLSIDHSGAATIAIGAVTSAKIADGTIANIDVSNTAAIAYSKLNLNASIQDSDASASSHFAFTNANQTFTGNNTFNNSITAPGITAGGAALGIGASSDTLNLAGTYSSNWAVTNGTFTTTIGFSGVAAHNVNYNFDAAAAAGTYTVCTTANNCVGTGGGSAIGGSGTLNTIAMFTPDGNNIGNSIITQSGSSITVTGSLNATVALQQNGHNVLVDNTAFSGDVSGNYNSISVDKLKGTPLSITTLADTNFLIYNSTSGNWENHSISGDINIDHSGVATIQANSVALGADTTGNYVANLGSLTGLTTTGNTGEGSTPTLSVTYGSGANTAVQGNTSLTCASGTGNLSGGGNSVTLGAGGSCNNIAITNTPTFSSNVAAGFQVQDSSSSQDVFNVNTLSDQVEIGAAGPTGTDGTVVFNNSAGTNTVGLSLQADPASSYTLLLPTSAPSTGECLQTDPSTANQLVFGNCSGSGSGVTTVGVIDSQTKSANGLVIVGSSIYAQTADATHPGLVSDSGTQTFGGTKIFATNSASGFQVQNSSSSKNVLTVDTSSNIVGIGTGGASGITGDLQFNFAGQTGSISLVPANPVSTAYTLTLPAENGTLCTTAGSAACTSIYGSGSGSTTTLAQAYANGSVSADQTLALTSGHGGGLLIQDANGGLGGTLFAVQDFSGGTSYLGVTATGISVAGTATASGNINSSGGTIQTNGTNRIDNSGNLVNIGNITASGTYDTNTFNSSTLTFGAAGAASVDAVSGQNLNLGTGASAHTTVLGSTTGASATNIQAGSGGIGLTGTTTINGGTTIAGTNTFTVNGGNTSLGADLDVTSSVAYKHGADVSTTPSLNDLNVGNVSLIRLTGASTQTLTGIANGRDGYVLTIINAAGQNAVINNNDTVNSSPGNRIITGTGGNVTLGPGSSITLVYDSQGSFWRVVGDVAGGAGAGVTSVGTFTSCTSYANGAQISGGVITFSCADITNPGMVGTGAQTWAGAKTFNALLTGNAGLTVTGGAVSLTGNAASQFSTSSGNLTLDSAATLNLGTTNATGVTVGNTSNTSAITLQGTAAATYTLGTSSSTGSITLGQSTAGQTINIGHAQVANGNTQTINIGDSATGTGKDVITIGNTNGASSIALNVGSGGLALGANNSSGSITIGNTGSTAQTILIGNNTVGADTVTVGAVNSTATTTILAGTGGVNIGILGSGNIQIGSTNNTAQTINIGNNAGNADTIIIGATTGSSSVSILAGSGGVGLTGATTINGNTTISGTNTLTVNGGLTTLQAGLTANGGTVNLNASSNNTTNINTGSSTGAVNVGNSSAGAVTLTSGSTITINNSATNNGGIDITGGIATLKADIATAAMNDFNFGNVSLIRLTGASTQTITGLANGRDGYRLTIINAGSQAAVIANQNTGSTTLANRIITGTGADISLPVDSSAELVYDSGVSRWRVVNVSTGGLAGSYVQLAPASAQADSSTNSSIFINKTGASGDLFELQKSSSDVLAVANNGDITASGKYNTNTFNSTQLIFGGASGQVSTTSGNLLLQAASGTVSLGTSSTLSASGALTIASGGSSVLTLNSLSGTLNLGSNTTSLLFSNAGAASIDATSGQNLSLGTNGTQHATTLGSSAGSSTTTVQSGSGGISLSGNTTVTGTNNFTVNGGLTSLGANVDVTGELSLKWSSDFATTPLNNLSVTSSLIRLTGASAQTLTGVSASGGNRNGELLTVVNAGSNAATISNLNAGSSSGNQITTGIGGDISLPVGASITLVYDNQSSPAVWRVIGQTAGSSGSGATTIGTYTNCTAFANGAQISGNVLTLGCADATHPGLIDNGTQTFGGAKTFNALLTGNAGLTVTGGAVQLNVSSNNNTSINTGSSTGSVTIGNGSAGAVGITSGAGVSLSGGAASSFTTTSGALTLQGFAGSSLITTNVTSGTSGAITIQTGNGTVSGTAGNISIDTGTTTAGSPTVSIGTANAAAVAIGRTGQTTTINGSATVSQGLAANGGITVGANQAVSFNAGSGSFDAHNATGAFQTSTGANSLNGATTVANDKSFTAGGTATFEDNTNAGAAFQIQTSGAADTLFTANSLTRTVGVAGNTLKVGNSTGSDTNTTILVLDSATAAPTTNLGSLNGGLFYDSTNNKVDVIENGVVKQLCNKTDLGCGTAGATQTLAVVYANGSSSSDSIINLDTTRGPVLLRDNGVTPLGGTLFGVQNSTGATKYLDVTAATVAVNDNFTVSGTINTNTFNGSSLTFGAGGAASIDAASGQNLNLGTGASNHTTTVGSTNGTSSTAIQSGSGGITLNGNTTVSSGKSFTADNLTYGQTGNASATIRKNTTVNGAVNANDVVQIFSGIDGEVAKSTANSTTVFGVATTTNAATAAQDIVISGVFQVNADAAALAPGDLLVASGTAGLVTKASSAVAGSIVGRALSTKGAGAGTVWAQLSIGGGGNTTLQTAYNNSTSPQITLGSSLGGLVVQDASTPIGAALFAVQNNGGATKYFNVDASTVTVNDGLTASGGAVSLTGNAASSFSTTSGNLTLQAGSGTVTLGSSTALTASGALSISSGGSSNVSIDTSGAAAVNIGTGNAASITIGNTANNSSITLDSGTGTIGIGTGNQARTVDIGTGAAAEAVVIGSTTGASGTTVYGGSNGISLSANTTLGNDNSLTAKGSAAFAANTNSATAFQIQNSGAADTLFNVNTLARTALVAGNTIKVGNSTGTDANTTILVLDGAASVPTTNLSSLSGGLFYDSTNNKIDVIENGIVKQLCNKTDQGCGTGGGSTTTLAQAYNNGSVASDQTLALNTTHGSGLLLQDQATNSVNGTLFQVQNASGNQILTVDDSANQVTLGKGSSLAGKLVFSNATNGNTVTLLASSAADVNGAPAGSLVFKLPSADGTSGQCLGTDGLGNLAFNNCSGNAGGGAGNANRQLSNLSGVSINASLTPGSTNSIDLGSSSSVWRAAYVRNITTDASTDLLLSPTTGLVKVDTASQNNELRVFENAASPTNYTSVKNNSITNTSGNLTLDAAGGTIILGTNTATLQKASTAFTFDLNSASNSTFTLTNAGTGIASLSVEGGVSIGSSQTYNVGAATGQTISCSGGNVLTGAAFTGGVLTTAGTCSSNGSTPTFSAVYNAGTTNADETATLTSAKGGLVIQDAVTPIGADLFTVESNGGTNKYLDVTSNGITVAGTINTNTFDNGGNLTFGNAGVANVNANGSQNLNVGTANNGHTTTVGSSNASATTTIQGGSALNLVGNTNVNGTSTFTVSGGLTSLGANVDVTGVLSTKHAADIATTNVDNQPIAASLVRLTGTSQIVTGFAISGGNRDGAILTIVNAGTNNATINDNSASSSAGNRIRTGTGSAISLGVNSSITMVYDSQGTVWRVVGDVAGGAGAGVTTIGAYANCTSFSNGAQISGNTLTLSCASISNPGLVDTSTQTFGGAKTFNALLTGSAGLTVTGGAVSLTGNNNSSLTTTAGTLLLQGTGTTTLSTAGATASNSADISIKTGNITTSGTAGSITIDTGTTISGSPTINLGNANAKALVLGNTGASFSAESNSTANLFNGATAHTVNIATGGAVQTVTIGSTNSTSSVKIQGGTGNSVNLESQGSILIGNNGVAQNITIGNATGATSVAIQCGTASCGFGNNATDHPTAVGSTTGASQLTLQAGTSGITATTAAASSGTTGAVSITSGNGSATGSSGNISIDVGSVSGTGTKGTIAVGLTSASGVTLGNTSQTASTLIQGGNISSAISLQAAGGGTIVIGSTNNNTITLGGSSSKVDVAGSLALKKGLDISTTGTLNDLNFGTASLIRLTGASQQIVTGLANNGSSSNNRDGELLTIVNAAGQSAQINDNNSGGTSSAGNLIRTGTGSNISLGTNASITLIYDSTAAIWRVIGDVAGGTGAGVTTVGTYSSATTCTNGAQIASNAITLCSASGNNPGLVDSSNQSFNGSKTFTGTTTFAPTANNAGSAVFKQTSGTATSGDILDVQGANGTTHFFEITQTAANAASVTLQSVGGSNGLTLQSGSGTVSLGTSTTLNASAALTVASGSGALTLNAAGGTINFGSNTTALLFTNAGAASLDATSGQNLSVGTNGTAHTVTVGDTATSSTTTIQSGTGGIGINSAAVASGTSGTITLATGGATSSNSGSISIASGNITTSGTAGNVTIDTGSGSTAGTPTVHLGDTNAKAVAIGNTGASFTAESNSTANLFNGATAHTVNIATGGAVQTVTIGSANSSSLVKLQGGTGNSINLESQGTITIGNNGVAQSITIGNGTGTTSVAVQCGSSACGFGNNSTDHPTVVGTTTGGSFLNLQAGTSGISLGTGVVSSGTSGAVSIASGAGNTTGSSGNVTIDVGPVGGSGTKGNVAVGSANASAVAIGNTGGSFTAESNATANLFNGATAHTVQLATGAAVQTVTVGSTNTTSQLTLQSGSNGASLQSGAVASGTSGTITLATGGATSSNSGSISIASGNITTSGTAGNVTIDTGSGSTAGTPTVHLGDTNAKAVAIGNTGASFTAESNSTANLFNGNTAHTIQLGAGATGTNGITIGTTNSTSSLTLQGGSGNINLMTSTGNKVQIGSSVTDANSTLFALDSYNNATDPTGVTGAMYYNTSIGAFRCFTTSWSNCAGSSSPTLQNVYDNSASPATITTSSSTKGVVLAAGVGSNSTSLFKIQNSAGSSLLNADSTNMRISVDATLTGMSAPSGLTATAQATVATPTVNQTGCTAGGSTSYSYSIVAYNNGLIWGSTSTAGSTVSGQATLSSTNCNNITWTAFGGATSYAIYRTASGGSPSSTGLIGTSLTNSFQDKGYVGSGQSAPGNGQLTSGNTFRYEVTAIDANGGETTASNEPAQVTVPATLRVNLAWTAVPGAAGYRIYKTLSGGASLSETYYTTTYTNDYVDGVNTLTPSSLTQTPINSTAYSATNNSNSNLQITIGGNSSPTGQLYVSGTIPTSPVGQLNFGGGGSAAPYQLTIQGKYAYLAMHGGNLDVVDISNPQSPVLMGVVSISNAPNSIAIRGKYAYVVAGASSCVAAACKLDVVDISNPAKPTIITTTSTGANTFGKDIYIQGRYAYITYNGTQQVGIWDISNPTNPVQLDLVNLQQSSPDNIYVQGRYAYVTTSLGMEILDVANPASASTVNGSSVAVSGRGYGIYTLGGYAYVTDTNGFLYIFDVKRVDTVTYVTRIATDSVSSGPESVFVEGHMAYVGNYTSHTIGVIDASQQSNPQLLGTIPTGTGPSSDWVQGRYLYTENDTDDNFQVFDIGGTYTQQLEAGGAEFGVLGVNSNAFFGNDVSIQGGIGVGASIQAAGDITTGGNSFVQGAAVFGGGKNLLGAPTGLTANAATSGGSLTGIYLYEVTAIDSYGNETTASNEVTTASLTSQKQPLSWTAVSGASGYKIYRTAAGGGSGTETLLDTSTTNGYTDAGSITPGVESPPTTDTTGQLTDLGSALFKNSSNSTSAFQVQNSSGSNILAVDTTSTGGVAINSAGTSTKPLVINNTTTGINLLEVKDLNTNFGSAVTGGAFIQRTSYFGEEFNKFIATNTDSTVSTTTNTDFRRGDTSELATSSLIGATAGSCAYSTNSNSLGGTERIAAASSTGATAVCSHLLSTNTPGTVQKNWAANNLPVIQMKVQPSAAPTGNSNTRYFFGLADNSASASGVPTNGIFFTNCTATTPTCNSSVWIGAVVTAGTMTTVTCTAGADTGTINTSGFNYLRIEVRANNSIHFFVDTNTTNGIVETECGTGVTAAGPGSTALGLYMSGGVNATGLTLNVDIDYLRIWQDDNITPVDNQAQTSGNDSSSDAMTTAPLTPDPDQPDPNVPGSFFNFLGATSEDTVINGNLFVHGTIYADKIKANEIEGLSVFTDQLASLQQKLQSEQATTTDSASGSGGTSTVLQTATTTLNLNDGLTVGGDANFHGNAFFYKLVTFVEKTVFNNDVSFNAHITTGGTTPTDNLEAAAGSTDPAAVKVATASVSGNDNSGQVSVTTGDNSNTGKLISVSFAKPFDKAPQVVLTATNSDTAAIRYYVQTTATGFTIYVIDTPSAGTNLTFNYFVIQ